MKREIKFRAWDGRHRKMHYGVGILNGVVYLPTGEKMTTTKNLMEYTGLKDKNKKDIYEGDIVRIYTGYKFKVEPTRYSIGNHSYAYGYVDYGDDAEVIGNIYEKIPLTKDDHGE